ncbi:anti-sigma factor domain-containing protein [Demequina sp. SO4-13]|uniref:anti-sigma factor domain-containing protein n=1 Tax=Demequina sp. SO4-13 TaxID=3401027 RepID=UPI003AF805C5
MSTDLHSLVGAYAVDALETPDRDLVERHLDDCSECREELASFAEVATAIADAHATAPPSALRARVMAAVGTTSQLTPHALGEQAADARVTEVGAADAGLAEAGSAEAGSAETRLADARAARPGPRQRPRRWLPAMLGAAASAVVIAVVALTAFPFGGDDETGSGLALEKDVMMVTSAPDARTMDLDLGNGHVVKSERMDGLALMGAAAPMPADGMEYQVWLVMEDGTAVPGPTFVPRDGGDYMAVVHMEMGGVSAVCITEEPSGGSTHPTMEPMLTVEL